MAFLRRALARRHGPVEVLVYAGSWIDETWVRSTALELAKRGTRTLLAVSGAPSAANAAAQARYAAAGVKLVSPVDDATLRGIEAAAVVTATNGLARSAFHPAVRHLVHMPHSIVSLHMIYGADSFDAFDTLFACGPHHVAEFDRLSAARGLRGRRAVPVGYGKLDLLQARDSEPRHVLVAPSWGQENILNTIGPALVEGLLAAGLRVTLRPHPLFVLRRDPAWTALRERFTGQQGFAAEDPFHGDDAILSAGVLVTDYSGVAFEHAALHGRRCVFVDVGKKVLNPGWAALGLEPVEIALRSTLGMVVPTDAPAALAAIARCAGLSGRHADVDAARARYLFNAGACGAAAADGLHALLAREQVA